jgi:hypothetical protein
LTTSNGVQSVFTAALLGFPVTDGNQSFSQYVQFAAAAGQLITSVSFTNIPSQDAFESANFSITSAVPEPGTWGMMLIGFGAVGYGMRRRRRNVALPQLA